jgi:hypothetical protein
MNQAIDLRGQCALLAARAKPHPHGDDDNDCEDAEHHP